MCPSTVPKSKLLYQAIFSVEHIHKAKFPKYSEVPYFSKGAEIVVVWKTKSYLETINIFGLVDLVGNKFCSEYLVQYIGEGKLEWNLVKSYLE